MHAGFFADFFVVCGQPFAMPPYLVAVYGYFHGAKPRNAPLSAQKRPFLPQNPVGQIFLTDGGKIVEKADVYEIFDNAKHPYTVGLLKSQPHMGHVGEPLPSIEGMVPKFDDMPKGCRFSTRCSKKFCSKCTDEEPPLFKINDKHMAACWLYEKEGTEYE